MTDCYLGLGSNLRSPERQLRQALALLNKLPRTVITRISSFYYSQPWGVRAQPPYCNVVIALHTSLPAKRLLAYCQAVEDKLQRIRKKRWGARTIDIDLLLYGNQIIKTNDLIIPHPRMLERDFVLVPLFEIAPDIHIPTGRPLMIYLDHCETYLKELHF